VTVGVGVLLALGDGLGLKVTVGLKVGVGEGELLGEGVGLLEALGDGVGEFEGLGEGDGVGLAVTLAVGVGEAVTVGDNVGLGVGANTTFKTQGSCAVDPTLSVTCIVKLYTPGAAVVRSPDNKPVVGFSVKSLMEHSLQQLTS
jgi:hypothetical protein